MNDKLLPPVSVIENWLYEELKWMGPTSEPTRQMLMNAFIDGWRLSRKDLLVGEEIAQQNADALSITNEEVRMASGAWVDRGTERRLHMQEPVGIGSRSGPMYRRSDHEYYGNQRRSDRRKRD